MLKSVLNRIKMASTKDEPARSSDALCIDTIRQKAFKYLSHETAIKSGRAVVCGDEVLLKHPPKHEHCGDYTEVTTETAETIEVVDADLSAEDFQKMLEERKRKLEEAQARAVKTRALRKAELVVTKVEKAGTTDPEQMKRRAAVFMATGKHPDAASEEDDRAAILYFASLNSRS